MAGLGPKLPLNNGGTVGYDLLKSLDQVVHQNLKNLLLTAPGERIMDPNFGVGLKRYLFEPDTSSLRREIRKKIRQQVSIYMPFVDILKISFFSPEEAPGALNQIAVESNVLRLNLAYRITPMGTNDYMSLDISG
tara:strand:+ start:941 stop:1345 length:405 start_codon:yes stop_codon:yes gene_type:complete